MPNRNCGSGDRQQLGGVHELTKAGLLIIKGRMEGSFLHLMEEEQWAGSRELRTRNDVLTLPTIRETELSEIAII